MRFAGSIPFILYESDIFWKKPVGSPPILSTERGAGRPPIAYLTSSEPPRPLIFRWLLPGGHHSPSSKYRPSPTMMALITSNDPVASRAAGFWPGGRVDDSGPLSRWRGRGFGQGGGGRAFSPPLTAGAQLLQHGSPPPVTKHTRRHPAMPNGADATARAWLVRTHPDGLRCFAGADAANPEKSANATRSCGRFSRPTTPGPLARRRAARQACGRTPRD